MDASFRWHDIEEAVVMSLRANTLACHPARKAPSCAEGKIGPIGLSYLQSSLSCSVDK